MQAGKRKREGQNGRTPSCRLILLCLGGLLLPVEAAAQSISPDGGPGGAVLLFASLGSGLITLLFSVAGSLVMAQYNRNVASAEAKIAELTRKIEASELLLRVTREEYARRADLVGLETLRQETRSEMASHRRETRDELNALREMLENKMQAQTEAIGRVNEQSGRILALLDPATRRP